MVGQSIEDVTKHYAAIIREMPVKPILIGHSFGGMIAEKLLGEDYGDRGHSLTIDSGWREVADACLAWLGKHGL